MKNRGVLPYMRDFFPPLKAIRINAGKRLALIKKKLRCSTVRSRDFERQRYGINGGNTNRPRSMSRARPRRPLYSRRMTGNDNKAPLAKISLSGTAYSGGTSPSQFDLLCFHVHTRNPIPQIRFSSLVSRPSKIDVPRMAPFTLPAIARSLSLRRL